MRIHMPASGGRYASRRIGSAAVRRLIALVSLLVAVDLTLWSAIVPLIPHYRAELGLTKVESGWLVAAFSLSVVVVAIPVGHLADRVGARRVVAAGGAAMAAEPSASASPGRSGCSWLRGPSRASATRRSGGGRRVGRGAGARRPPRPGGQLLERGAPSPG